MALSASCPSPAAFHRAQAGDCSSSVLSYQYDTCFVFVTSRERTPPAILSLVKTSGSPNAINRTKRPRNLHTDYYGIWRKLFLFLLFSPFFDGWQAERPVARSMLKPFGRMNEVVVSWRLGAKDTKPMPMNFEEGQGSAKLNGHYYRIRRQET